MRERKGSFKIAYMFTPIEFGGAEKVSLNFLNNVNRKKFDIHPVLLIRPWEKDNIIVKKLGKEKYPLHKIPTTIRTHSEGRGFFRFFRCFWCIHSFLKKGSFDLLHTHGYFADIIGIPAAKILRIPSISTCHGFISTNRKLVLYNTIDRIMLRFTNKILVVSEGIKADLQRTGITESKIKVIQNAVQEYSRDEYNDQKRNKIREMYKINEKEFVLGYVGRLSKEKGLKYFIEASAMLIEAGLPIKVLIIGEGAQKKELESLSKMKGIGDKVVFSGFQNEVEKWLSILDVFVLPSMTEGTPMSLLEAMALGLPVVASAVGGVPDVIDSGKNGMLVSPGKPDEIKDVIYNLYHNEGLRKSISTAARDTISLKYNVKDWTGKIETEYLELLGNI